VEIHAAVCMCNHWHAVVTDPDAKLPRFLAMTHRLVSKCVNVFRGRWESMWSSERYSAIPLLTADDVLDKIIYCRVSHQSIDHSASPAEGLCCFAQQTSVDSGATSIWHRQLRDSVASHNKPPSNRVLPRSGIAS